MTKLTSFSMTGHILNRVYSNCIAYILSNRTITRNIRNAVEILYMIIIYDYNRTVNIKFQIRGNKKTSI